MRGPARNSPRHGAQMRRPRAIATTRNCSRTSTRVGLDGLSGRDTCRSQSIGWGGDGRAISAALRATVLAIREAYQSRLRSTRVIQPTCGSVAEDDALRLRARFCSPNWRIRDYGSAEVMPSSTSHDARSGARRSAQLSAVAARFLSHRAGGAGILSDPAASGTSLGRSP